MSTLLANDENQVFYVIKVNGVVVSAQFTDRAVAESQRATMPPEAQASSIVEAVTHDGKQVLFG